MYLHRTLENFAKSAAGQFPVLLVTGARQVGKTTFLRHLSEPGRTYVSLDDAIVLDLAKRDPALFLQRFRPPLLIDEIQYAPELLPYIKMEVDETRQPNLFWLTGSQQFHLMKGVSESLAGRVAVVQLLGLSRLERIGQGAQSRPFIPTLTEITEREQHSEGGIALRELYRMIWRGSYPAIALNEEMDRDLFYSSYVQTYLQRDVRDLARVGDELLFLRFLRVAAARTGQLLNLSEFARDADIAVNTAKNWLSIAQASGIVYLLEPYYNNLSKRLIKAPKLYFLDTGLCAYLTEWSSPETLEAGAMSGAILETWVISELLKSYLHSGKQPPFYYYRDKDKKEIDVLIARDGTIYPLEIKKTASPSTADIRAFGTLEKLGMPIGPGGVICLAQQSLPITDLAMSIPVGVI
ncbi:MAG: ATP-binding protein [Armatimonadota bacterium]